MGKGAFTNGNTSTDTSTFYIYLIEPNLRFFRKSTRKFRGFLSMLDGLNIAFSGDKIIRMVISSEIEKQVKAI